MSLITSAQLRDLHPGIIINGSGKVEYIRATYDIQRQRTVRVYSDGKQRQVLFWSTERHAYWRDALNAAYHTHYRQTKEST